MKKKQATRKRKQVIVFLVCGCKKPSFLTDDIQTFWHGARRDFVTKTDQRHPEGLMIKRPLPDSWKFRLTRCFGKDLRICISSR